MKKVIFNNIGLRNKLLFIYICTVFIPITLTHIVFYHVTTNNIKDQKRSDISLSLKQIASDFRLAVDDAVGISSMLYTDYELYNFLEKRYGNTIDYIHAYNDYYREISIQAPSYASVHSINLYTDNETVLYNGGIKKIDTLVKDSHWYKYSEVMRSSYPVLTRRIGDSGLLDTFSLIRELDYYYTKDSTQKILEIELDFELITSIFQNVTFPGDIYLVNEQGMIQYTTNSHVKWSVESASFQSVALPKDSIVIEEAYHLPYLNDWKVIGIAQENVLLEDIQNSRNFIIYLALINLIFPSLLIIYFTSSLHARIIRILKHMRKVEDQNFEIISGIEYQDEIGELTHAFNRMASKIKRLINEVYKADIQKKNLELQRKQAQINALQSQINPHFLFNVLETIRMRSHLKREEETAKIIHYTARMLRRSFVWGKDWVTIEEEVNLIKCFLEIQHYRFDEKLQYQIDMADDVKECLIPNMSFIPFVENASIHGIEPIKGNGLIQLVIERTGDKVLCEIRDTGQGMSKEECEQLMDVLLKNPNDIGEHVGMKNVYYRLKLLYGDQFDFQLVSEKGVGTTVRIVLPFRTIESIGE